MPQNTSKYSLRKSMLIIRESTRCIIDPSSGLHHRSRCKFALELENISANKSWHIAP